MLGIMLVEERWVGHSQTGCFCSWNCTSSRYDWHDRGSMGTIESISTARPTSEHVPLFYFVFSIFFITLHHPRCSVGIGSSHVANREFNTIFEHWLYHAGSLTTAIPILTPTSSEILSRPTLLVGRWSFMRRCPIIHLASLCTFTFTIKAMNADSLSSLVLQS